MAAVVQAEHDARRKFDRCGSHAEAGTVLKVVQEGLQGLVQDLIRGLGRMDVAPARPVAGPGAQLLDAQAQQGVLHIAGDSRPVGARHGLGGAGFGRLAQVRPGSEQLIQHGNCQGGWEAALWAALHPGRVNTLIVAGAPIDTSAGNGLAKKLMPILIPGGNMALFKAMVKACGGIVPGINNLMGAIAMHPVTHVAEHLKVYAHVHDRTYLDHFSDFYDWYLHPVNLPGQLYLWAVEHLFVNNELFTGELEVAGQKNVSLRSITCPVFLLGGEQDDITPWQQVRNMRDAVGSAQVRWYLAPGGHIGLFIGRQAQAEYWTPILAQVRQLSRPGATGEQNILGEAASRALQGPALG